MRKKYLSALLFGALLVTSAGTFTSCKDYDDEINNLQEQITANADAIKALQDKIGDGKFVTNVASESNGLKITWNDGSSTVIENVINGEDQKGDVVSIDPETGEIKINDKGTGFFASKGEGETPEEVKLPYVNEEGVLVIFDEKGEEVVTGIRVSPVTAIIHEDGSADITIIAADGTSQTVKVPSAATAVTDLDLVGYAKAEKFADGESETNFGGKENGFYSVNKGYVAVYAYRLGSLTAAGTADWKGNKPSLKENEVLAAYKMNGLVARVAPLSVDASELEFSLVNSKKEEAPLTISMSSYSNNAVITRAASKNGMYSVNFEYEKVDGSNYTNVADWISKTFGATNAPALFALSTKSGLISKFDIAIKQADGTQSISNYYFNSVSNANQISVGSSKDIEVNKKYTVLTNDDSFIYDAYLTFDANDIDKWGIQYDKANDPLSFTVTKLPDNLSTKEFTFDFNYLTKNGTMYQGESAKTFTVKPKTNLDSSVQLCSEVSHRIVNDASKNFFTVSLDEMFKSLGESKKLQWIRDVDVNFNSTMIIKEGNKTVTGNVTASFAKDAQGTEATKAEDAKYIKFKVNNNASTRLDVSKSYVATIKFESKDDAQGEYANGTINTVTVPFKFTIPSFDEMLQKDMNIFDAEGKVATAYLVKTYRAENYVQYVLNGLFTDLRNSVKNGFEFKLALDDNTVVTDNQKSSELAYLASNTSVESFTGLTSVVINNSNIEGANITLVSEDKDKAYGKELIVKLSDAKYCGYKYDYSETFKIKLLSAIKEGKLVANGGSIKLDISQEKTLSVEDIWATTMNDKVRFDLFKKVVKGESSSYETAFDRTDISSITFATTGDKFTVLNSSPTEPVYNSSTGEVTIQSGVTLKASNLGTQKLKVTVVDSWGYKLEDEVDVVVK